MAREATSRRNENSRRELVGGGVVLLVIAGVLVTRRGSPQLTHASETMSEPVWVQHAEPTVDGEEEHPDRTPPPDDR